jgi:hypothetical protein
VCRPKHVEQLRNIEIINSTTRLHLVGPFYEIRITMHGSMNIKFRFKLQRQNFDTEQLNVCVFGCCICPDYILISYRNVKDRLWLPCIDRDIKKDVRSFISAESDFDNGSHQKAISACILNFPPLVFTFFYLFTAMLISNSMRLVVSDVSVECSR